jgi:hypothetical protein
LNLTDIPRKIAKPKHRAKPYLGKPAKEEKTTKTTAKGLKAQPDLLRTLADLCDEYCGNVLRLDIGADARIDPTRTVDEQAVFLKERMLLIRRPAQSIQEQRNVDGSVGY